VQLAKTLLKTVGVVMKSNSRRAVDAERSEVGALEQLLHLGTTRHWFVVAYKFEQGTGNLDQAALN
jgi:hypothetical protein